MRLGESVQPPSLVCVVQGREGGRLLDEEPDALPAASGRARCPRLHYYFQYTLNDYEREGFEPNVPALEKRIETFRRLSERIGPDRVVWRFDPIILSPGTGPRDILMRIWTVGKALRGLTKKLVVSFVDVGAYRKVQANLVRDTGLYTRETVLSAEPDEAQRREICEGLAKIRERWHSEGWDIEISSCAEEARPRGLGHYVQQMHRRRAHGKSVRRGQGARALPSLGQAA